jgi:DNA-binding IclR family transcriptional regulator
MAIDAALEMFLGENGIAVLESLMLGAATVEEIHLITGLPLPCILTRVPVLKELGFVDEIARGNVLSMKGWAIFGFQSVD